MPGTISQEVLDQRLQWARRGTAHFARKLNELADNEFDVTTGLSGWSCRHLVAHVGYNARAIARLVDWAATGVENPMYASSRARSEEIESGATMSALALRNPAEHAAVDLDVLWRDLPVERWAAEVRTAQGRTVPAAETPWMRAREVWIHAVDLGNGVSLRGGPYSGHWPDPVKAFPAGTGRWAIVDRAAWGASTAYGIEKFCKYPRKYQYRKKHYCPMWNRWPENWGHFEAGSIRR